MSLLRLLTYALIICATLFQISCHDGEEQPSSKQPPKSSTERPQQQGGGTPAPESLSLRALNQSEMVNLGFRIPSNQGLGDVLPPQPGQKVDGSVVTKNQHGDINWTAFTLVLYKEPDQSYKVLSQKRAITHVGTLETAGGHLTPAQTWRDGARVELEQETGIKAKNADFIFLSGAKPIPAPGNLYGNANFFVVFNKKPATQNRSGEIDKHYGHQWLDLKQTFLEMSAEEQRARGQHGKYYNFFREHLLEFCAEVIDCKKL